MSLILGSMDSDGDSMDDPIMFHIHEEVERLAAKETALKRLSHSGVVTVKSLEGLEKINVGHELTHKARRADSFEGKFTATLGTRVDAIYLKGGVISEKAPLGKALLGSRVRDIREFETPDGKGTIEILSFSPSPLLRN